MVCIHTWPVILGLSIISFLIGIIYLMRDDAIDASKANVFLLTSYGIISSGIIVILVSIWHIHPIWGEWIHMHPESHLTEIVIFHIGDFHVDLLTIAVLLTTAFVYCIAMAYSQIKLGRLYEKLKLANISALSAMYLSKFSFLHNIDLFVIEDSNPTAFSFSRLTVSFPPEVIDTIVISTGMIDMLEEQELEGVFAHEFAHCMNHDTRYAHLMITLRSILRIDPILKRLEKRINHQQELTADKMASEMTLRPKALAIALFKLLEFQVMKTKGVRSLFSDSKELLVLRIERLLEMDKKLEAIYLVKKETLENDNLEKQRLDLK